MKKLAYLVIGIGGILALLILGENILIPFMYGIILWFLGHTLKNLTYKVPVFKKYLPSWLVSSVIFLVIIMLLSILVKLITTNIDVLIKSYPVYASNVNNIADKINEIFNIDIYQSIFEKLKNYNFSTILQPIADSLSGILSDTVMVLLYALFIVSEETSFTTKLKKLFKTNKDYNKVSLILNKISDSISDYLRLKTLVSILTGVVCYIFLLLMDVEAPFFWALLTFFLNYIPTIGSLIATIFPSIFSLFQFGEFTPFIIILVVLGVIQWLIGNILEPKIMGSTLNISPLASILSLVVWGEIWGITGMLLSIPITVVMVIVFAQFESTKSTAILLSENGDI
ncbi:AI-2E family transporter [Aquimarina addita]|uniref:AI-2E family transporter n=1 Tax=Aquimarina addita TaxID=870485 RepID=A0ABP6UK86_9FLAO